MQLFLQIRLEPGCAIDEHEQDPRLACTDVPNQNGSDPNIL